MKAALDVLNQEGVIGIFPEGGIWEPAIHKAQSGVAWLSYHGKSPILPIGFSATAGKLEEALALKRPYLKMHVGKLIPPVKILPNHPKKYQFQQASQEIMKAVRALLPKENLSKHEKVENEKFEFYVTIFDSDNNLIQIPQELELTNGAALSKILYRSTLINNFRDNLHLNITPLKNLNLKPSAQEISDSTGSILNYIKFENPYYFTYRYGLKEGSMMQNGIQQLHDLAKWAILNGHHLHAIPKRIYSLTGSDQKVIENHPPELKKW
jgi:hypothetical protein